MSIGYIIIIVILVLVILRISFVQGFSWTWHQITSVFADIKAWTLVAFKHIKRYVGNYKED
jgi:hypothetical protein